MKRDELIRAIEKMRANGVSDAWREEFIEITQAEVEKRNALADDFHRAIVYCFIFFTRVGYLNKERRNFLRPTKRALLMMLVLLIGVILQVLIFAVILDALGLSVEYAFFIIITVLLFELGYVITKGNRLIRGYMGNRHGLSKTCIACGYDLNGLDSVLGEKLWVGPEICPECGQRYPAVV